MLPRRNNAASLANKRQRKKEKDQRRKERKRDDEKDRDKRDDAGSAATTAPGSRVQRATTAREAMTYTMPRRRVTIANPVAFKWKAAPAVCLSPTTATGLMPQEWLVQFNNLR